MKILKYIFIALLLVNGATYSVYAQSLVKGSVSEFDSDNRKMPLVGASIQWAGTTIGTVTDADGKFQISMPLANKHLLVVSFVGFAKDTIEIKHLDTALDIVLLADNQLDEAVITEKLGGLYISMLKPMKTEVITSAGLQKLACCNLSESFENSATVDVSFSDAVSGAKQIKMLGLAGTYSQIITENVPSIRGLLLPFGLNHIPGAWLESIQISKGTSSVLNGYEAITGQINLEIKKPQNSSPLFVNLYANQEGRTEANVISALQINEKLSTSVLGHFNFRNSLYDENHDGFIDSPRGKLLTFMNRWNYATEKTHNQLIVSYLNEERNGGQTSYFENNDNTQFYGIGIRNKNLTASLKSGLMLNQKGSSIALITSATNYAQESFFGKNNYIANQKSAFASVLFTSNLWNFNHKIATGVSWQYDSYSESFKTLQINRIENIQGAYMEYTWNQNDKITLIAGARADYNSEFGFLFTPRAHLRYAIAHNSVVRASVGKGYHSANILAENTGIMASSRRIYIDSPLEMESAWNYGANFSQKFTFGKEGNGTLTFDYYRTWFENQVITDLDKNAQEVHFYNLNGKSYSNSLQAEMILKPLKHIEITTAFRFNDVQTTINGELRQKPLTPRFKGLFTGSYSTKYEIWRLDLTLQYIGESRLPDTFGNPAEFRLAAQSPDYMILHAQITKKFKRFDVYFGGENLTGFMQKHAVVDPQNPFSEYFDTSIVWAPLTGRMLYAGLRFDIK